MTVLPSVRLFAWRTAHITRLSARVTLVVVQGACSLAAAENPAITTPFHQAYEARYVADRPGWWPGSVEVVRRLRPLENGVWQLSVRARDWMYDRQEVSRFDWKRSQPRSLTYQYRRKTLLSRRVLDAGFDWQGGLLHIEVGGERWAQPLREDSQDMLACQLWLRMQAASGVSSPTCHVTDGGPLHRRVATAIGQRDVLWKGKAREAIGYRLRLGQGRTLDVWLVPSLNFVPVDIRYDYAQGDVLNMRLVDLQQYSRTEANR